MINVFTFIVFSAILALFLSQKNFKKFYAIAFFGVFAISFIYFLKIGFGEENIAQSIRWIHKLRINFSFNAEVFVLLCPAFAVGVSATLLKLKQNTEDALKNNALIMLNFATLIFISTAGNLLQILMGLIFIDICGIFLLKPRVKEKNIYYNFVSDMLIFFVFMAIYQINGRIDLNNLSLGPNFKLLETIFTIALSIKVGFFGLNNYILKINDTKSYKELAFLYNSSPYAALIVIYKLSFFNHSLLSILAIASAIIYMIYFMIENNLKAKIIYFSLANFALSIYFENFSIIPATALLGFWAIIIMRSASFEENLSGMGNFIKKSKFLYFISIATIFIYLNTLSTLPFKNGLFVYGIITIIALSLMIRQIFFANFKGDDKVFNALSSPNYIYYIPLIIIFVAIPFRFSYVSLISMSAFFILTHLIIFDKFIKLKNNTAMIKSFDIIENLLIQPLKILGRVLWLTIDFLLIQKTILYSSNNLNQYVLKIYKHLEEKHFFWISLGFVIMLVVVGYKLL